MAERKAIEGWEKGEVNRHWRRNAIERVTRVSAQTMPGASLPANQRQRVKALGARRLVVASRRSQPSPSVAH